MASQRGATVGSVLSAMAIVGAVGVAGWAVMTGTTPCQLLGSCSTDTKVATAGGAAVTPASANIDGVASTPSCCKLGGLAEQAEPGAGPVAGEVIPASVHNAAGDAATHACTGEGCDPAGCEKGDACCAAETKNEDAPVDSCCAGGEHG